MRVFVLSLIGVAAIAAYGESANLAFKSADNEAYTFDTGVLRGTLRNEGRSIGLLKVEHVPTGTHLEGNNYGIFGHYRVFTKNKRYGGGAWDWPSTSLLRPDGSVEVHWAAAEGRPFDLAAVYRWSAPDTLDVETSVTAHADLTGVESFLASYFAEAFPASTVCVKSGPDGKPVFQTTEPDKGIWQAFPRNKQAVTLIQDGRWKIEPNPVDWAVRDEYFAPLGIRRNPANNLCAIIMAPATDSYAVMTPQAGEGHRSFYLAQIGRDIKTGESATARARLVLRTLAKDNEAVPIYESYTKSLPTGR